MELFRDTSFGKISRIISRGKLFPYPEDKNPEIWQRYVDTDMSANMAHHGTTATAEEEAQKQKEKEDGDAGSDESQTDTRQTEDQRAGSSGSSNTRAQSPHRNEVSGAPVDPEKGRDVTIVTWYSDTDSEVSFFRRQGGSVFNWIEPDELEHGEKVLRHVCDLLLDVLGVHRVCHILGW